jgi:hypothetical protein
VFVDDGSERGTGEVTVSRNRIRGNRVLGLARAGTASADATCNWWGASDGPRTRGGSGDGVASELAAVPFLTSDDLDGRCAVEPRVRADATQVVVDEGSRATVTGTFEAGSAAPLTLTPSTGEVAATGGNVGTWTWTAHPDDGPRDTTPVTVTADNGDRDRHGVRRGGDRDPHLLRDRPRGPPDRACTPRRPRRWHPRVQRGRRRPLARG